MLVVYLLISDVDILKEIVGASVSVGLLIYMLWFIVPELKTTYNAILPSVNATNPTMAIVLTVSDNWFTILPLFVLFIGGYTVYLYLSRREASDYE